VDDFEFEFCNEFEIYKEFQYKLEEFSEEITKKKKEE
jgi:hypothetical protein